MSTLSALTMSVERARMPSSTCVIVVPVIVVAAPVSMPVLLPMIRPPVICASGVKVRTAVLDTPSVVQVLQRQAGGARGRDDPVLATGDGQVGGVDADRAALDPDSGAGVLDPDIGDRRPACRRCRRPPRRSPRSPSPRRVTPVTDLSTTTPRWLLVIRSWSSVDLGGAGVGEHADRLVGGGDVGDSGLLRAAHPQAAGAVADGDDAVDRAA